MILFGAMLLHDVQRVLQTAEKLPFDPDRPDTFDPINAAMAMYMDCLNIFVRFVQLFALQEVAKRIKKWCQLNFSLFIYINDDDTEKNKYSIAL